jgi:hypothetical protein
VARLAITLCNKNNIVFNCCHVIIGIKAYVNGSFAQPVSLVLLCSYVTSHCLAVVPQSGEKQNFYCTVYHITLNSNYQAQRASKFWEKIVEAKINAQVIECNFFTFLKEKIMFKSH